MPVKATDRGCCSTWSTRRSSSRWTRLHHLRHRLRAQGRRATRSGSSPPTRSGSTCARPATRSSTSSAASAQGRHVHVAEAGVRRLRPLRQEDRRPGRAGQRQGRGPELPTDGRVARRDRELHRRHADRDRRPPAPGRAQERDRPASRDGERSKRIYTGRAGVLGTASRHDQAGRPADVVGLLDAGDRGCRTGACA